MERKTAMAIDQIQRLVGVSTHSFLSHSKPPGDIVFLIVRLLEVGCAVIVNGKSPYQSSLASKLTHVFVETALHNEIKALQLAGVQCLSPDYIPEFLLQVKQQY